MRKLALLILIVFALGAQQAPQILGDPQDVQSVTKAGTVLMGGAGEVSEALKWITERCNGGDFLVISTKATSIGDDIWALGGVNSVETLIINSRELANSPEIVTKIRNAEGIFIPGGDQSEYIRFWKDTETAKALNYVLNEKKIPIGGTSAGMAIMGEYYYAPHVTDPTTKRPNFSLECLADPFHRYLNGLGKDFLKMPLLQNIITDSHYTERNRHGRHLTFMARLILNFSANQVRGIGVDENTALCIDPDGSAEVMGDGKAYFLHGQGSPEVCEERRPLTWNQEEHAVKVYSLPPTGHFDLINWDGEGGTWMYWYVQEGALKTKPMLGI